MPDAKSAAQNLWKIRFRMKSYSIAPGVVTSLSVLFLLGTVVRAQSPTQQPPSQTPAAATPAPAGTSTDDSGCLEETGTTCTLRWELVASSATGSSTQTNNSTQPNILFKLNWQLLSPKVSSDDAARQLTSARENEPAVSALNGGAASRAMTRATAVNNYFGRANTPQKGSSFALKWTLTAGFTQVSDTAKLQSVSTSASSTGSSSSTTGTTTTCSAATSGSSASGTTTCTAATQQEAFVVQSGFNFGWTMGQHGNSSKKSVLQGSTFAEAGFALRGSGQVPVQSNQVVQSNGNTYVNLTSLNQNHNVAGFYESVGRFRIATHDAPPAAPSTSSKGTTNQPTYANASDFLVAEAGYQYNSGLSLLASNPTTNTKPRFVGRFYVTPEISSTNHTKLLIGMEYSAGVNGGSKVVQLFFGTNLNLAKLLKPTSSTNP